MTEQQFKKKVIIRIVASTFLFATGIFLYLYTMVLDGMPEPHAFREHYFSGVIGGITGAGIATAVKNFIILKSRKYFKKQYICETDERNKQISQKAWAWAGYVSIYTMLVATFFMPSEVVKYMLCLMCVPLVVYVVIYKILQAKM